MAINSNYLESSLKQLQYYKTLAEKAVHQLEEQQLFTTTNDDSNSIAVIMQHMTGNMLSRWTDIFTTDGEKEWRNRDSEFVENFTTKEAVFTYWEKGWDCFLTTLQSLQPEDLSRIIYIRNEGHTVLDATNRQLMHYAYHIGQIVFYAKQLKQTTWESLSIPKNKSAEYNTEKFAQEKKKHHFTDNEIKK